MKVRRHNFSWSMLAPALTIAGVLTVAFALPNYVKAEGRDVRQAEIREAVNRVSYMIGPWSGQDKAVPPEAQELLKPNATLSRTYEQLGKPRVHLLIVHCGDMRDMTGHYPPVCYPSAGWQRVNHIGAKTQSLNVGPLTVEASVFEFARIDESLEEERIQILNFFILPGGATTGRYTDIARQSDRQSVAVEGVAQVQIITNASVDQAMAADIASELFAGMPQLLSALRITEGAGYDQQ